MKVTDCKDIFKFEQKDGVVTMEQVDKATGETVTFFTLNEQQVAGLEELTDNILGITE